MRHPEIQSVEQNRIQAGTDAVDTTGIFSMDTDATDSGVSGSNIDDDGLSVDGIDNDDGICI